MKEKESLSRERGRALRGLCVVVGTAMQRAAPVKKTWARPPLPYPFTMCCPVGTVAG